MTTFFVGLFWFLKVGVPLTFLVLVWSGRRR